jgi:myo-inositol catabolism protein IolC
MTLGYDRPLYMLAFDHRASFSRDLFGIEGSLTADETARVADAKHLIFDAFEAALADGVDPRSGGLLVDEEFGSLVARRARRSGYTLAMPVEKSGQNEFDFEFGDDFGRHIEAFDATFAKVLVRYNPEGDSELNRRQAARLAILSDWLHARGRKFLFELLVPGEPHQLQSLGGAKERFDAELRPALVVETMRQLQAAGVEPDIWKIEGFESRQDCVDAAVQARAGGRDAVACIVLGCGADRDKVRHWLDQAEGVPGYIGFAVGRTLWWDELVGHVAGELSRTDASTRIARNYAALVNAHA